MSVETLLSASQDEALHGSDKYYPQAWAFVHYLMFGNRGAQRANLSQLLRLARETDIDSAFATAFAKTYKEFDGEMRAYLNGGSYGYAEVPLRDRSGEMEVAPATAATVEFALGRAATAAGNAALALEHAERVIALIPNVASGYELKAYAANAADDEAGFEAAVERAVALGSRDAFLYEARADRLVIANQRENSFIDDFLGPEVARTAADLYQRALGLKPRSDRALQGFVMTLLNVGEPTELDELTLTVSRTLFPQSGFPLVGQAAVQQARGNPRAASQLLKEATTAPYTLPNEHRRAVTALRANWLGAWVTNDINSFIREGQFAEAYALASEQLADDTIPGQLKSVLENVQRDMPGMQRVQAAIDAGAAGKRQEAVAILTALADDPNTPERPRRAAARLLQQLGVRGESPTN